MGKHPKNRGEKTVQRMIEITTGGGGNIRITTAPYVSNKRGVGVFPGKTGV